MAQENIGFRKTYKQTGNADAGDAGKAPSSGRLRGDGPTNKPTSVLARVKVPGVNQDTRKTL